MANPMDTTVKQVQGWWTRLTTNQKIIALLAGITLAGVGAGTVYLSLQPDYAVLYSSLSSQDAGAIVEHIREKGVSYRLSGGGGQVEVPSKSVYDLRLELAGKGLPHGDGVGFEIFDKMSFGVTDEVQRINYLRALQSELERTIESLEAIEKARVHLVMPKEDLWFEETLTPSASVMVKLSAPGSLLPRQTESIRHLLASAVRGLMPERVTIVDTMGKVLSAGGDQESLTGISDSQFGYKQKIENGLKQQAESLLTEILGPGRAAVRVHAEIDFDQVVKEREYYEPVVGQKGLVRSEQQNNVSSGGASGKAAGTAGVASNLQGYPPSRRSRSSGSKQNERYTEYEMNRTRERVTTAIGTITMLSVGVFIDGDLPPERLADVSQVLARSLGINPERGDQIEVKALPFNRTDLKEQQQLMEKSQREKFWLTMLTTWVPRGLLVMVAIGLLVVGARSLGRHTERLMRLSENGKQPAQSGMNSEKVLDLMRQNPGETGQILKHWLS